MKKTLLLLTLLLSIPTFSLAQDANDYHKQFEAFRSSKLKQYADYRDQLNAEFAKFLEEAWTEFQQHRASEPPVSNVTPLPVIFDPFKLPERPPVELVVPKEEPVQQPIEEPAVEPIPTEPTPAVEPIPEPTSAPVQQPEPISEPEPISLPTPAEQPTQEPIVEPSPVIIPTETPEPIAEPSVPAPSTVEPSAAPLTPTLPISTPVLTANSKAVDFFGDKIQVPWDKATAPSIEKVSEKAFSRYWTALSKRSKETIEYLDSYATSQKLNGWGYYQLVRGFSESVYPDNQPDNRIAMQVYLLSQLGFLSKAGVCGERLILLLPITQQVYFVPFIKIDGLKYYIYSYGHDASKGYRTYGKNFAAADKKLNLAMDRAINIGKDVEIELPKWSTILGETFKAKVNKGLVDYELNYPFLGGEVFYNQVIPEALAQGVIEALKPQVADMTNEHRVRYILNLVQNGFEYMTDYEAFGRAKQLFVEESFYYGRNNCKDRVAIFSWLVESLTGLDTVFIIYDGTAKSNNVAHIACAVAFETDIKGDSYIFEGKRYVVCDPTYINAGIGRTMSYYDPQAAKVVRYKL